MYSVCLYVVKLHLSSGPVSCLMSDNDVVSTDCLVYLFLQYSQRVIMRIKSEQKTKAFGAVAGICGKKHILFTRVALQKFASLLLFFYPILPFHPCLWQIYTPKKIEMLCVPH